MPGTAISGSSTLLRGTVVVTKICTCDILVCGNNTANGTRPPGYCAAAGTEMRAGNTTDYGNPNGTGTPGDHDILVHDPAAGAAGTGRSGDNMSVHGAAAGTRTTGDIITVHEMAIIMVQKIVIDTGTSRNNNAVGHKWVEVNRTATETRMPGDNILHDGQAATTGTMIVFNNVVLHQCNPTGAFAEDIAATAASLEPQPHPFLPGEVIGSIPLPLASTFPEVMALHSEPYSGVHTSTIGEVPPVTTATQRRRVCECWNAGRRIHKGWTFAQD